MYTICLCSILRFFWNLLRSYDPKCQILQQLMTKLVHSNFGDNNPAPFPLWWTEAMLKHENVSQILWGVKGWKKTMLYSCLFSVFFYFSPFFNFYFFYIHHVLYNITLISLAENRIPKKYLVTVYISILLQTTYCPLLLTLLLIPHLH